MTERSQTPKTAIYFIYMTKLACGVRSQFSNLLQVERGGSGWEGDEKCGQVLFLDLDECLLCDNSLCCTHISRTFPYGSDTSLGKQMGAGGRTWHQT